MMVGSELEGQDCCKASEEGQAGGGVGVGCKISGKLQRLVLQFSIIG